MIGGFYSEGHCDYSTFALEAGWYRRSPIPVSRVVRGDTFVGPAVGLANANRLCLTWAFIWPSDIERGERATAPLAYGWESEIGAVSEVLAEPAPCKMPVRSTQIRGAVTRAEGACGELPCPGCICMGSEELVLGSSPPFG